MKNLPNRLPLPLLLSLLLACAPKLEQPDLPADKMARIMADLFIAESATVGMGGYPKDSLQHAYFQQVLQLHQVTLDDYERNLRLYAEQDRMDELTAEAEALVNPAARDSTPR